MCMTYKSPTKACSILGWTLLGIHAVQILHTLLTGNQRYQNVEYEPYAGLVMSTPQSPSTTLRPTR